METAGETIRLPELTSGGCEHTRDASLQRIQGDTDMVADHLLHERFGAGAQALTIGRNRLRTWLEAA